MEYETLILEIDDSIATITLNRPDSANALDLTMARELVDVSIRCDESSRRQTEVAGGCCCATVSLSQAAVGRGNHKR